MDITISNVSFSYNSNAEVFKDLNLRSSKSQTVALVGASGCGKSTLLRLCCGLLPSSKQHSFEGEILIDGQLPSEIVKMGHVGFMFQEATLFPNLTVEENIMLPLKLNGANGDHQLATELIEIVGLSAYTSYLPSQLSGGMKTRVSLARTFISKPKLLLLDEPFSSLDIKWKFKLYRELEILRSEYSPTIVLVTHDINEALLLSNNIFVFGHNGQILNELHISKSLPRVQHDDSLKDLQKEYFEIQSYIMQD